MIRHPFSLEHVASECSDSFKGLVITDVWTQEKYVVNFILEGPDVQLIVSIDVSPDGGLVLIDNSIRRARKNSVSVLTDAIGQTIALVTKQPEDRVLTFWLDNGHLHAEMFSGGGNVLYVANGIVTQSLRDTKERASKPYLAVNRVHDDFAHSPTQSIQSSLATSTYQLGKHYAEHICIACSVDPTMLCSMLDISTRERIEKHAKDFIQRCLNTPIFLVLERAGAVLHSLQPLSGWDIRSEHNSILSATDEALRSRRTVAGFLIQQKRIVKALELQLRKNQKSLEGIGKDELQDKRGEMYRVWADCLMNFPFAELPINSPVSVVDESAEPMLIPVDIEHSYGWNATKYYNKARSSQNAVAVRKRRIPQYQLRIAEIQSAIDKVRDAKTVKDLPMEKNTQRINDKSKSTPQTLFREFKLDSRHTLYVGRNAKNNDELTMRFAKQQDWWLHARGAAGSHAVLRGVEGAKIPKDVLELAAAITAYYSQARNASYVPVVYTQKKNVRKPKGANIGAVVVDREQTVMVKPSLPSGLSLEEDGLSD